MMQSVDWREMFTVELADEKVTFKTEPGECNSNCQLAKEIKCVCRCGGKNHGAALKKNVRSLDEFEDGPRVVPGQPSEMLVPA